MPEDQLVIKLSSHYYFGRLERLIRQLTPLLDLRAPARVVVDLSGLTGIGPTCLALLTAAMMRTYESGLLKQSSRLIAPKSPPVALYIQRMNLAALVTAGQSKETFVRKDEHGFMSCRRFHTLDEGVQMAGLLAGHLEERCRVDKVGRVSVELALGELTDNVVYHADTPLGGFAVCQHYPKRDTFEIAIADLGIGIGESLARNPDLPTPQDCAAALDLALTPRITSTPERNAGLGLFVTAMLLQGNEGQFHLRSGDAVAMRGTVSETSATAVALPGTLTTLQVKTDRPLNIEQVYARFKKELGDADD